jgi:hypothetical protein
MILYYYQRRYAGFLKDTHAEIFIMRSKNRDIAVDNTTQKEDYK